MSSRGELVLIESMPSAPPHPDAPFLCSICIDLCIHPVSLSTHQTYCLKCVAEWLRHKRTCPATGLSISDTHLVINEDAQTANLAWAIMYAPARVPEICLDPPVGTPPLHPGAPPAHALAIEVAPGAPPIEIPPLIEPTARKIPTFPFVVIFLIHVIVLSIHSTNSGARFFSIVFTGILNEDSVVALRAGRLVHQPWTLLTALQLSPCALAAFFEAGMQNILIFFQKDMGIEYREIIFSAVFSAVFGSLFGSSLYPNNAFCYSVALSIALIVPPLFSVEIPFKTRCGLGVVCLMILGQGFLEYTEIFGLLYTLCISISIFYAKKMPWIHTITCTLLVFSVGFALLKPWELKGPHPL